MLPEFLVHLVRVLHEGYYIFRGVFLLGVCWDGLGSREQACDAHKAWNQCPLSFVDRNPGLTRLLCGLREAGLICKQ